MWEWFQRHYPATIKLVPRRRKAQFLNGVRTAFEQGRIEFDNFHQRVFADDRQEPPETTAAKFETISLKTETGTREIKVKTWEKEQPHADDESGEQQGE